MRRLLAVPALIPLLAAAIGCGDDGGGGDVDTAAAGGDTPSVDGGPVTIDHAHGSTTVEQTPERIVSLDVQWTDILLAMGHEPVGYAVYRAAGEDGIYPWQEGLLDDATEITVTGDAIPFEQIVDLDPDLILVTHVAEDEATFDLLADIAPTIGLLGSRQVDPWQDMAEVAGTVVGDPERAGATVADIDALMAETADVLPGLDGKTFALANYVPGDAIYVVADPDDGSTRFFEQLGMELDPALLAEADGAAGRIQLSLEQVPMLGSDLLVLLTNGADPDELAGYSTLPSVVDGSVAQLERDDVVGLNTPTPLSVPYVLDLVRPALDAAAES